MKARSSSNPCKPEVYSNKTMFSLQEKLLVTKQYLYTTDIHVLYEIHNPIKWKKCPSQEPILNKTISKSSQYPQSQSVYFSLIHQKKGWEVSEYISFYSNYTSVNWDRCTIDLLSLEHPKTSNHLFPALWKEESLNI